TSTTRAPAAISNKSSARPGASTTSSTEIDPRSHRLRPSRDVVPEARRLALCFPRPRRSALPPPLCFPRPPRPAPPPPPCPPRPPRPPPPRPACPGRGGGRGGGGGGAGRPPCPAASAGPVLAGGPEAFDRAARGGRYAQVQPEEREHRDGDLAADRDVDVPAGCRGGGRADLPQQLAVQPLVVLPGGTLRGRLPPAWGAGPPPPGAH